MKDPELDVQCLKKLLSEDVSVGRNRPHVGRSPLESHLALWPLAPSVGQQPVLPDEAVSIMSVLTEQGLVGQFCFRRTLTARRFMTYLEVYLPPRVFAGNIEPRSSTDKRFTGHAPFKKF